MEKQFPRPPLPPLPSGNDPAVLSYLPKWNWGAALLQWAWAFGHQMSGLGVLVLLASLLGLWPFTGVALGIIGNDLAWRTCPSRSYEEFLHREEAWTRAAIWVTVAGVIVGAVFLLAWAVAVSRVLSSLMDSLTPSQNW